MLRKDQAVLVVVDVQNRLVPVIHEADATVRQMVRLIQGFRIVGAPVLVTEQYPQGLGATDERIRKAFEAIDPIHKVAHHFEPYVKMSFSCMLDDPFRHALATTGRRQVVLCGVEAHVCVYQTALHLLEHTYHVEVAADAISSRAPGNRDLAIARLRDEGVKITCVESAVFEMIEHCGSDPFKAWVKVIK